MEEILNVKTLDYQSPSWTRSALCNDKVIEWVKAKVCVYADSVLCLGKVEQDPEAACANWTTHWKSQTVSFVPRRSGSWWRTNWIWLDNFPRIYNNDPSQGDPEGPGKEENRTGQFQRPDHLYVYVQWHWVDKRMMINAFRTPSRSRILRTGFYQDIDFSGSRFGKEVFDGQGDLQPTKWYSNSEKLVILFSQLPVLWVAV